MSTAEAIGFAVAWGVLAAILVWSIVRTPAGRSRSLRVSLLPQVSVTRRRPDIDLTKAASRPVDPDRWVTLETLDGSGPDVVALGEMLVGAALAARGLDSSQLERGDLRTEVVDDIDGSQATRFLVRTRLLSRPRTY